MIPRVTCFVISWRLPPTIPYTALDLKSSFVSLGGTSTQAISLSVAFKRLGIRISVAEIILAGDLIELLAKFNSKISRRNAVSFKDTHDVLALVNSPSRGPKNPLLSPNLVKTQTLNQKSCETSLSGTEENTNYLAPRDYSGNINHEAPMTEMQLLFLHGGRKIPGSNVIRFAETYQLSHVPAVKRAWETVILGEPSLQVDLATEGEGGIIRAKNSFAFSWVEVHTDNCRDYESEIEAIPSTSIACSDFRVIIRDDDWNARGEATVIWRVHHALIDGYSAALLYKKFQCCLQNLPPAPGTSFLFVAQQLQDLQSSGASASREYWMGQCAKYPDAMGEILLPKPLGGRFSTQKMVGNIFIDSPQDKIKMICRKLSCTPAAFYCAAWSLVLSRYTNSESVVFGLVCSGRGLPLEGAEDTIGPLINTLPLFANISGSSTVASFVKQLFISMSALSSIQYARATDGFVRKFSSAIAMEYDMSPLPDASVKPLGPSTRSVVSDIPLSICVFETGRIQISYQTACFREVDVIVLAEHFESAQTLLLRLDNPMSHLIENFLLQSYRQKLLEAANHGIATRSQAHSSDTLLSLFDGITDIYPSHIALEKGHQTVTYEELRTAVRKVAHGMQEHVQPGDILCVHADRSINWIIAIYACMELGAVYAPIDPTLPTSARERKFSISGSRLLLTPFNAQKNLKPRSCKTCLSIESFLVQPQPAQAFHMAPRGVKSDWPAYICFTSGSTGLPKAVLCTHEGLVAFQKTPEVRFFAKPGEGRRISQIMSPAFDGSIHEIFSALSYGATLVLASSEIDPTEHLCSVDAALMTPTLARALDFDALTKLQYVYLVGEPVPQTLCDELAGRKIVFNMYGPTETTCGATISRLWPGKAVTIGRPNPSSRVYILDSEQRLLPPGVAGEIYIAGVQVARGYLGRPDETRAKFLMDNICPHLNEKMYRTGDFGYWTTDGEVCYLGRRDRQVKLRGFRIDLNDLEHRLAEVLPQGSGVAIAQQQDWLVAFIQPSSLDAAEIRRKAAAVLQPEAVPRFIASVDKIPMTQIGKRDYKAISAHDFLNQTDEDAQYLTLTENRLATIWREILHMPPEVELHPDMNFLAIGGDSISQIALANRVSSTLQCSLETKSLLEVSSRGSLRDLARSVDSSGASSLAMSREPSSITTPLGTDKLSLPETQWFHRYQNDDITTQFNVSMAWTIKPRCVDTERLASAINHAIRRHRVLYSRYETRLPTPLRSLRDPEKSVVMVEDFDLAQEVNRPFRLDRDVLIRVFVSRNQVALIASHIICDLTALVSLLRDVEVLYTSTGEEIASRSYFNCSCNSGAELTPATIHYWRTQLKAAIAQRWGRISATPRPSCSGSSVMINLGASGLQNVRSIARTQQLTSHQVVLAAVAFAVGSMHDTETLLFGGPYLNRDPEDMSVVGLFLEPLAIVLQNPTHLCVELDWTSLLKSAREGSQQALGAAAPWTRLITHFGIAAEAPSHLLFDAMVTYHDRNSINALHIQGLEPVITWANGAKFRIMCEFTALDRGDGPDRSTLLLRLEYMHTAYTETQVLAAATKIAAVLKQLASEASPKSPVGGDMSQDDDASPRGGRIGFGSAIDKI